MNSMAQMEAIPQEKQELDGLEGILAMTEKLGLTLETAGRYFPPEIIAQILDIARLCFQDAADRVFQMTLFRQVCSQWNDIALNDPLFWKDATLMIASESQWQAATALSQTRLLQHPELTLDLHVICQAESSELLPEGVVTFIHHNVGRLSHFDLRPGSMYYEILDQVNRGWDYDNYPTGLWGALESLTVVSSGSEDYRYTANVPLIEIDVPLLKTVTLGGFGRRELITEWGSLPFKQFTSITLRGFTNPFSDYFAMLHECTQLEYLSIDITNVVEFQGTMGGQWNISQATITFPSLTTLNLKTYLYCDLGRGFFKRIHVPSLKHLNIEDGTRRSPNDGMPFTTELFASLVVCLAASSSKLLTCELLLLDAGGAFDDTFFVSLMTFLPTLLTLIVSAPSLSCAFLNRTDFQLPPSLQVMRLTSLHPASPDAQNNFSRWYQLQSKGHLQATLFLEPYRRRR